MWLAKKTKRDAELKEKEMKDQREEKRKKEGKERNDMIVLLQKPLQVQIDSQQKQQHAANVWSCV